MLVTNDVLNDPRVQKEALGAVKEGFEVIVLGYVSERTKGNTEEIRDGYRIVRLETKIPRRKPATGFMKDLQTEIQYFLWFMDMNRVFAKAVRRFAPDIVHANDLDSLPGSVWGAKRIGAKVLYDAHELWVEMYKHGIWYHKLLFSAFERYGIRNADYTVTVNGSIADIMAGRYKVKKPSVVHNCPWRHPGANGHNLKQKMGIHRDTPLVIYQGRFDYDRGLEELVLAGEYLDKAVLALRGYGSNEADLRRIAEEKGLLDKKVIFLDPVEMSDLVPAIYGADIGVIPYKPVFLDHLLSTPNKLFEYMMAGLSLVANDLPEIKRVIQNHGCGITYENAEPKRIAETINRIAADPDRLEAMKKNSRTAASTRFCWENEMNTLISHYHAMTDGSY